MKKSLFVVISLVAAAVALADDIATAEKHVDDLLVASIRFQGQYTDIGQYMGQLFQVVGDKAAGPCIALYYDGPEAPVHDVEICVPVSAAVNADPVTTRTLAGGDFFTAIHTGSYGTIGDTWGKLIAAAVAANVKTAPPAREVYLAYDPDDAAKNVTELQMLMAP